MSYTINLTNGTLYCTIPDGTLNNQGSMTLIGKNYAGYGQFLDDNFVHLLENSANGTAPSAPLVGQLWYNTTTGVLNVYRSSVIGFKPLAVSTTAFANAAPSNNTTGDFWYDKTNQQLKVYGGTGTSPTTDDWILVGPTYSNTIGITGAIAATITSANTSVSYPVVELVAGNSIVGIVSAVQAFTPASGNAIAGFSTIYPGITLSSTISNAVLTGTATNSLQLDGLAVDQFMRTVGNTSTTGTIAININGNPTALVNSAASGVGNIGNAARPFNTFFGTATTALVANSALTIDGANITGTVPEANNSAYLGGFPASSYLTANGLGGNINVTNIFNSGSSGTGTIGNVSVPFNTIYARATTALYADVAERFAADAIYAPGTVVELGGTAEITSSQTELSDSVFGVISTQAAYLMNGGAGPDATHPPVAMTGRVPVKVTGVIRKGDRLVSAGNGIARAAQPGEATAFNVIGRALVEKLDAGLGTVEAIVSTK